MKEVLIMNQKKVFESVEEVGREFSKIMTFKNLNDLTRGNAIASVDQEKEATTSTGEDNPAGACENENLEEMVASLKTEEQTSPRGLTDEPSKFRNIGWTTEELPPEEIKHFTGVHDYHLPTEADRPIVARTPKGYSCLDGWDLIKNAKANGATTILVDVDNIEEHSDEELCLRKMVLRMNTRGDQFYAEIMRNTRDVCAMLQSSREELKVFTHGGRRDKVALNGNRGNDAVGILAFRMRKDRDTVTATLNHVKYLSNDAIQFLIEQKAKKKFFEDIQSKKKNLYTKLTSQEKTALEKTEIISKFILEAFVKSIAPKPETAATSPTPTIPISPVPESDDDDEFNDDEFNEEDPEDSDDEDEQDDDPTREDDRPSEGAVASTEEPLTVETIKDRVITVTKQVIEDFSKDISLAEMRACLEKELSVIMSILSHIDSLSSGRK